MHLDVRDLRNFYYRTQLGRVAQRAIRDQLGVFWPEARAQTVAAARLAAGSCAFCRSRCRSGGLRAGSAASGRVAR